MRARVRSAAAILIAGFAATGSALSQDLLGIADEILQQVVQLRGLEPKEPISKGLKTQDEIRAFVLRELDAEYPESRMLLEQKTYIRMGLMPASLDLRSLLVDLLTEQIAGFYDPKTRTLYIADWIPEPLQRPVMAHELVHALQDQYFGLQTFLDDVEDNEDALLARKSLVEGEGLAIMLDYVLAPVGQKFKSLPNLVGMIESGGGLMDAQSGAFARTPAFLRELLLFQYSYGAAFVQTYLQRHAWEDVATLYSDPPRSSEQIIHPEKYFEDRDDPQVLDDFERPDIMPEEFQEVHTGVLGEFMVNQLLKPFVDEDLSLEASRGWDGDRFALYEGESGRLALVMHFVWDTERDLEEFSEAFRAAVMARHEISGDSRFVAAENGELQFRNSDFELHMTGRGKHLVVIDFDR